MVATFRIDEAYLVGGWCAAALWGAFTCFVAYALWQAGQLQARNRMTPSKYLTITAVLVLYSLSTTHISLALKRLITGFIYNQGPATLPYFANIGLPLNRDKDMIYIHSMFIADSIVVWRCYIVWGKNKLVIALPVVLWLATIACGYGAILQYFIPNPNGAVAANFGLAMFAVSLTTNTLVTTLTVGRIWWLAKGVARGLARPLQSTYRTLIVLLIESGVIITMAKLVEFVLFKLSPDDGLEGLNALYIIFEMIPHINGIMPTIIIIVVNAQRGFDGTQYTTQTSAIKTSREVSGAPRPGIVFAANSPEQSVLGVTSKVESMYPAYHLGTASDDRAETISLSEVGNKGYRGV